MAKYSQRHSCGHSLTVELFGAEAARRQTLARAAERNCAECEAAAAAARAAAAGLPVLIGTSKQAAWADQIRTKAVRELAGIRAKVEASADKYPTEAAKVFAAIDAELTRTNASQWIEGRMTAYNGSWLAKVVAGRCR